MARPRLGTKRNPFKSPESVFAFLQESDPEWYVFRGQNKEYSLPLLPSAMRDDFQPLNFFSNLPFDGITESKNARATRMQRDIVKFLRKAESRGALPVEQGMKAVAHCKRSLKETFELLKNASYNDAILCKGAANNCLLALRELLGIDLGTDLGMILAQQYGFNSTLLDVTTKPDVALFFATRIAPFWEPVRKTDELGVVYRFPKEVAVVPEGFLRKLESDDFVDIVTSLMHFVEESNGLDFRTRPRRFYHSDTKSFSSNFIPILISGTSRASRGFVFPKGAFDKSRIGRQGGAFLDPAREYIPFFEGSPELDASYLVGDLLKTKDGEAFYFRHSSKPLDLGRVDKYYLWPIQEDTEPSLVSTCKGKPVILPREIRPQDFYFRLLVLLFSPYCPVNIFMWKQEGDRIVSYGANMTTLCDPGFAIHPREAETIVQRLLHSEVPIYWETKTDAPVRDSYGNLRSGPISFPLAFNIPLNLKKKFWANFNLATERCVSTGSAKRSFTLFKKAKHLIQGDNRC